MMKLISLFGFVLAALAVEKTIWETAVATEQLSSLVKAVNETQSVIDLLNKTNSSLTLFAPSNNAFAKLEVGFDISSVLTYHLLNGAIVKSTNLTDGLHFVESAAGFILEIKKAGVVVEIVFNISEISTVTTADIMCAGGVVHIIDTVLQLPEDISKVAKALDLKRLLQELNETQTTIGSNVTVFAPNDIAFNTSSFDNMSLDARKSTLQYHIVKGVLYSTDLTDGQELTTELGDKLLVKIEDNEVFVGGAKVEKVNALTTKGVVHVISSVIRVPNSPSRDIVANLALQPETTLFAQVINMPAYKPVKDQLETATNATVFPPSNDALEAALKAGLDLKNVAEVTAVLSYHVLPDVAVYAENLTAVQFPRTALNEKGYVNLEGQAQVVKVTKGDKVKVNEATVITADLANKNDVVAHVIDQLLAIPANVLPVANASGLTILLEQLNRTGLVTAVSETPLLTVLAPTNEAFNNFNSDLSTINTTDVKNLLLNHVFPGDLFSTILANRTNITSLGKKTYNITVADGVVMIDGAKVLTADVLTQNGVVHTLDRVLGGPEPPAPPKPASKGVSPGAVVGIVIGVLAGVAIVGYCCFKSSNDEDGYKPM